MQALFLSLHTPLTPVGVKRSKHFFSENSHVAYQIKGSGALSTMQAHILSLYTPSTPGVWSNGQNIFFSECDHVAYQIKGKKFSLTCKQHL